MTASRQPNESIDLLGVLVSRHTWISAALGAAFALPVVVVVAALDASEVWQWFALGLVCICFAYAGFRAAFLSGGYELSFGTSAGLLCGAVLGTTRLAVGFFANPIHIATVLLLGALGAVGGLTGSLVALKARPHLDQQIAARSSESRKK